MGLAVPLFAIHAWIQISKLPPLPPELRPPSANLGDRVYQWKDGKPVRYWIYFGPFGWIDP